MSRHLLTHMPVQSLRLPLRSAHQACGGRAPLRGLSGFAILGFMRSTTRKVFASLTSTSPHAPQKSRQAALFDYAQSAACHAFCGDGACPVELATLGGQPLRGFRGSTAGNPPAQARRGSHCSGGCFAAETEGVLCVRSPKTAHTRRPARRIKRPSVPPAARGSAPAAAQEAAGRRKPWPLRRVRGLTCSGSTPAASLLVADPLGFRPLPGASPLVGPPPAARVHLLARWRPSVERRPGERSRETRDRSPCRRTH